MKPPNPVFMYIFKTDLPLFTTIVKQAGLFLFLSLSGSLFSQQPVITVRFANPVAYCGSQEYCVDVEFTSDIPGEELFGMNVRFFYDDQVFEFIDFRDYAEGYGPITPNPPYVSTSTEEAGILFFGFSGPADYVNGAVQLVNPAAPPVPLGPDEWTRLFRVCLALDSMDVEFIDTFCQSLVWDLEVDPANGSFLTGSDGVVITVRNGMGSAPAIEHVVQFNWEYLGDGEEPPYGQPIEETCHNINCLLPVQWVSISGRSTTDGNVLEWITVEEVNVDRYQIEAAGQDFKWKPVGSVHARSESPTEQHYVYLHHLPESHTRFYRVKSIDLDGRTGFSPVVVLSGKTESAQGLSIYPNPVMEGEVEIHLGFQPDEKAFARIFDCFGKTVNTQPLHSQFTRLNLPNLPGGIYFISVSSGTKHICKKIIIY